MELSNEGRILYVSMADVSQPNGPGVNEREFLLSLFERLGDRAHAILPSPQWDCEELDHSRIDYYHNPKRWDLIGFLRQQLELYRLLKRFDLSGRHDLVVARLSLVPLAFWMWSLRGFPFAVKTLGAVQGFTRNPGLKGLIARLLAPINGLLFRSIIRRAIAVDCCTETHYREHLKDYSLPLERLQVIENATNVKRFSASKQGDARSQLGLSQFSPVLGFVGGSPADRGGQQMLNIASRLKEQFPQIGVVIVGDDRGGQLEGLMNELDLQEHVALPGLVAYEEIPLYVNTFDVGFALDRPERMVKTGNSYQKVRQYLACGKPVVTYVEEESDLNKHSLVESVHPDDEERLVQATLRVLRRDPAMQREHAVRSAKFVQERLSTEFTLAKRLRFWTHRLAVRRSPHQQVRLSPAE